MLEIMSLINYYDILGCTKEATAEDIKRAYHVLALKFHPDKSKSELDSIKFQRVLEAWHVLRDPELRKEYDAVCKQEELDSESVPIYARISIKELETMDSYEDTLIYRCRCGGLYSIQKEYIEKKNQPIRVPCLGCTFFIIIQT